MPADYLAVRNACYLKKRKDGKLSDKDKAECKKMAAIVYYKRHGKTVQEAEGRIDKDLPDKIDIDILDEQIAYFGSLEAYEKWSNGDDR